MNLIQVVPFCPCSKYYINGIITGSFPCPCSWPISSCSCFSGSIFLSRIKKTPCFACNLLTYCMPWSEWSWRKWALRRMMTATTAWMIATLGTWTRKRPPWAGQPELLPHPVASHPLHFCLSVNHTQTLLLLITLYVLKYSGIVSPTSTHIHIQSGP